MQELKERIAKSILRNPGRSNCDIAKNFKGVRVDLVREVRDSMSNHSENSPGITHGVDLRGVKVLSRRPAESAAKFIKRLPTGKGFDPKDLSRDWGMSEETIRRHARDLGCLKYVEVSEDEWVPLILNPTTAKQYSL